MSSYFLVAVVLFLGQDARETPKPSSSKAEPATGPATPAAADVPSKNELQEKNSSTPKEPKSGENGFVEFLKPKRGDDGGFFYRLYKAYYDQFFPSKKENGEEEPEKPRRALPPDRKSVV